MRGRNKIPRRPGRRRRRTRSPGPFPCAINPQPPPECGTSRCIILRRGVGAVDGAPGSNFQPVSGGILPLYNTTRLSANPIKIPYDMWTGIE
ncbi:hypothetical protein EVAR_80788_1 [Eumeta japonica]|uniref:Uncharacterized protein n=1 Tax=Eumeta variegata TaxID=151549 RepID=A0A4C1WE02_EUMVA|nr:hypothetical protein EVAR_80788_1 [Eumeta japonica]